MTGWRLWRRNLAFHARANLGTVLGAAVGTTVLVGALGVGDSVRASLREQALLRLGNTELALASGDRLFRAQLANDLQIGLAQAGLAQADRFPTVALLDLPAVATTPDGRARANGVHVVGVDQRFWLLADRPPAFAGLPSDAASLWQLAGQPPVLRPTPIPPGNVLLNQALAHQLRAQAGDEVLLRVQRPAELSQDAPLSPAEHATVALRVKVRAILSDTELGRFSLQASQIPPFNAFVSLPDLQTRAGAGGRANLLLVGRRAPPVSQVRSFVTLTPPGVSPGYVPPGYSSPQLLPVLTTLLHQRWHLEDAQLSWAEAPAEHLLELRSSRIFLEPSVCRVALDTPLNVALSPALPTRWAQPTGVLTYLVNTLRVGGRTTPYSMVSALGPGGLPTELRDDEVLINQWLADDLAAHPGDELTLTYYVVGRMRQLEERSAQFRIRGVFPMNTPGIDSGLMPDFPGVTNARNCRDWDTGLPIQTDRIRDKDEQYWHASRGTPKALITLAAGQRLWRNRFGDLTAVRWRLGGVSAADWARLPPQARYADVERLTQQQVRLTQALLGRLDPGAFGLNFTPARAQALAASNQAQDFGQLFLGFSFFLIVAALLLMAVLFQLSLEQRAGEVGILLALGFTPRRVRWLLLGEAAGLAALGGLVGVIGGLGYARAMLHGLTTVWSGAVASSPLGFHVQRLTLISGLAGGVAISWLTLWLALRREARQPVHTLLAEGATEAWPSPAPGKRPGRGALALAWTAGVSALGLLGWTLAKPAAATAETFFSAGGLLLIAGLAGSAGWLARWAHSAASARQTLTGLALRGATRRRKRSLATVALLACGSFLIVSIGAFHLEATPDAQKPAAGTGGFALIGEATQPVLHDLTSARGRAAYGLDTATLRGVRVVACRLHEGDEASCLNLNRAQNPRLLGVQPEALYQRGAFTFVAAAPGCDLRQGWRLLQPRPNDDAVPAIGDQASILWALGKQVGDVITYTDERGQPFKLRLVAAVANSILQGSLIIGEDQFVAHFPTTSGYRIFLIDAPSNSVEKVSAELTRGLADMGLALTPTIERLAAFNQVQNTYLGTFQVLGGLGLLLGSVGLGVVVLRNVLERRGELALLLAVGFRPRALHWLVAGEHGALLAGGLAVGTLAALVAVLPPVFARGVAVPYGWLSLLLAAVLLNGALWTWLATLAALRGRLLDALRNE